VAHIKQHESDCIRWLGSPFRAVHEWLDHFATIQGPTHRAARHHVEGINQARRLFGEQGAKAAIVHILRDCRNIPRQGDYNSGKVDPLGLRREWAPGAYADYSEEVFAALVRAALEGPSSILLWAFFRNASDLENMLRGASRLTGDEISDYLHRWPSVASRAASLPQLEPTEPVPKALSGDASEYLNSVVGAPLRQQLEKEFGEFELGIIPVDHLINPLALLDVEYIEQLRPSLEGTSELALARFAIPQRVPTSVKAMMDPTQRSVSFVSPQKTVTAGPLLLEEYPDLGLSVRCFVSGTPQMILVSNVAGRLYLRSGIHRSFLLAESGAKEIPCILVREANPPAVSSAYPVFSPAVLAASRPPLLVDALDPELSVKFPSQRTHKIIRISVEELVIPVE
jgi:hypothetical protein